MISQNKELKRKNAKNKFFVLLYKDFIISLYSSYIIKTKKCLMK